MNFDRNRHPWIHSHHYSLERYHHSRKGTLASILHLLKTVDFWYAICYCRGVIYFPEFLYEQNPAACTHCMGVIHHSDFGCVDQCAIPLRRLVFSFFFFLASILLYRVLLLYFPFDEHLECLEVWGIAIKTAVNTDTYVFGIIYTFKNLGYLGLTASICGRYIYIHTHTPLLHTIYTHKVAYMPYMHIHKVAIIFHILTNNFSDFLLFKELCDI